MESCRVAALCAALLLMPSPGAAQETPPTPDRSDWGAPGLNRVALYPTPDLAPAGGTAFLRWDESPFGVSVTRDGSQRYRLDLEIEGLPEPGSLGEYRTYVAWATTPIMDPVVRLGEVGNGTFAGLGPVAFDKFVILISAEPSAEVESRTGRLALRGASPSTRILPDNHLMVPVTGTGESAALPMDHGAMDHAAMGHGPASDEPAWSHPPMLPETPMVPGLGHLRPEPLPFLPRVTADETLPDAVPSQVVRLQDGQTLDLTAEPGPPHHPRPRLRHVRLQRAVSRAPDPRGPGLHDLRQLREPHVLAHRDPLARAPPRQRLRRRAPPHPGPRPSRRALRVPALLPRRRPLLVPPHHREEVQQDLGLYGNMLVEAPPDTWYAPVHREEILMLDDLLIADDGGLFPFGTERATHSLMGRFGNLMLVNGEPEYALELDRGEVVRFFLTNVSNTRTFNLSFGEPGTHRIKVVGSDLSKFERETWVDSVALAPAERYIVEVRYETAGEHAVENRVRPLEHTFGGYFSRVTRLGTVTVRDRDADPAGAPGYAELRENAPVVEDVARFRSHFDREPDYELLLTMDVTGLDPAIMQRMRADRVFFPAVEWADTMPMMNSVATPEEVRWIVREPATGREDMDIAWRFSVGDVVTIRITNDAAALHAMQHPFHIHGQRFLVLRRNGAPVTNQVFKDTVLIPAGETVDLLLEITNPGKWMAHCHIAEHLEAGMRFVFEVDP